MPSLTKTLPRPRTKPRSRTLSPAYADKIRDAKAAIRNEFSSLSDDVLLSANECAAVLGVGNSTLKAWTYSDAAPKVAELGRNVKFRVGDIRLFIDQNRG